MNEWIARINYASAFKSAGVRMRSLGMSNRDIELTGIAAAASHLKDVKHNLNNGSRTPVIRTWNGRLSEDLPRPNADLEEADASAEDGPRGRQASVGSVGSDVMTPPFENTSRLFKATFDEVKTELATGKWRAQEDALSIRSGRKRAYSLESVFGSPALPALPASPPSASRLSSRPEIMHAKIADIEARLARARAQLDADLRLARNLAALTPFQRATRDRVQAAAQATAKRAMQARLDVERLVCHRDVLAADLAAEERHWRQTKRLALRAATQKLASECEEEEAAAQRERAREREEEAAAARRAPGGGRVPTLTLSAYVDGASGSGSAPSAGSSPMPIPRARAQESSAAESFHSALSGGSAWHSRQASATAMFGSPKTFRSSGTASTPGSPPGAAASPSGASSPPRRQHPPPLATQPSMESTVSTDEGASGAGSAAGSTSQHEKFATAPEMPEEQAEEWHKTRAAKRVSLVKLPSDLRIPILFGKHARDETAVGAVAVADAFAEEAVATPTSTSATSHHGASPSSPYTRQPNATVTMLDM